MLDDIQNLTEKIWKYLPSGDGGCIWSQQEKEDVLKMLRELFKLHARITKRVSANQERVDKLELTVGNLLKEFGEFSSIFLELLSSQADVETLERIEEKYGSM